MKATVGRIVHFYDESLRGQTGKRVDSGFPVIALNGQGDGPYPAIVLQTFNGPYVHLLVHAFGGNWCEGSVSEKADAEGQSRYWVWPPRE